MMLGFLNMSFGVGPLLLGHGDKLGTGSGHKPGMAFLQATKLAWVSCMEYKKSPRGFDSRTGPNWSVLSQDAKKIF
jgi:hypothetical protein